MAVELEGARRIIVQLQVRELSETPGQSKLLPPQYFRAWSGPVPSAFENSAYCIGTGPKGRNQTEHFWMSTSAERCFQAATRAALSHHYTISLLR